MKELIAVVREKGQRKAIVIKSEYKTKKAFRQDLNKNGYQVIGRIEDLQENSRRKELYEKGIKI